MGERWESIEFEDPDPAVVLRAIRSLGLDQLQASDFPTALAHIAGFAETAVAAAELLIALAIVATMLLCASPTGGRGQPTTGGPPEPHQSPEPSHDRS
jgi:hypothetical protein